jgi:disease resistance protein RPS2
MGVADKYTITMDNLFKDESWELFAYHAFPYNNRSIPENIDDENAKLVCHKCGGLPLAIKVVGRAMAGCTNPHEWKSASRKLPNDHGLDACLRLSYDALYKENTHLQLCFLYIAASFSEDQIIHANHVIPLWAGEGLLVKQTGDHVSYSSFALGRFYVNLLADRCLIEPILRNLNDIVFFKIHDVLRDLGIRIAEAEKTFYCGVGRGLRTLDANECSRRTRILLSNNKLSSLPNSMRAPELCSLIMDGNKDLTKIPKRVIKSMVSLKVLDLSGTSVQSLPESVGSLKQLACLLLSSMPINLLPASLTNLVNLEILDLSRSSIRELPANLHNLKSLRHLAMDKCDHLLNLPCSFSRLTSLERLSMYGCTVWGKGVRTRRTTVASINNLASLKNLARLDLTNNGEVIREGTFRNMIGMDTLNLQLTKMESLPTDMINMSNLNNLYMECPDLVKMESNFCDFQNITDLTLFKCGMLEELPYLHKLKRLRKLEIIECSILKKLPQEFGDEGVFSSLKIFSLVRLHELKELPEMKEGAMPLLQKFIIVECPALKIFPKSYFNLKTLQIIKVYGCTSIIVENLGQIQNSNTMIEVKTMSIEDTRAAEQRYSQVREGMKSWLYGEYWSNEHFHLSVYALE